MLKYLLLVLLLVWLWYSPAVRRLWRPRPPEQPAQHPSAQSSDAKGPNAPGTPTGAPAHGLMVRCGHCGIHLPQNEALMGADGQRYCCEAHRQAGPASSDRAPHG
ncbi:PP0621 family protein [Aquabacterium fontiphilum]|uniref:PP0621 family protein n=1 Tax=Aquabacterium fontiphilum TaxID=450365 RepID=UPI001F3A3B6A|nr:PP0621 family protein [Aquabacterium fontiphilum]